LTIGEDNSEAKVGCTLNTYSIAFKGFNIYMRAPYGNIVNSEIIFKKLPTSDPKQEG